MTGAEIGELYFENQGGGHKPRNTSDHRKLENSRKSFSSQRLQKEPALPTLGISPMKLILDL